MRVASAAIRSATRSSPSSPTRAAWCVRVMIASRSRSFLDSNRPYTAPVDRPDSRTTSMILVPS